MSKRKGLSADEKQNRMLEFFHETKGFFQLKELERQCAKEKGIPSMTVKAVLQNLCDDAKVDTEKIGTSVYFWSYPSKEFMQLKKTIDKLDVEMSERAQRISEKDKELAQISVGKDDTEERAELLKQIAVLEKNLEEARNSLKTLSACDPMFFEELKLSKETGKVAVNRWTDNIFALRAYINSRFHIPEETINGQFGISNDIDYV
ncbi:DgyrCDS10934 [Dimorphilus gyrociliatus]|uniref:Meiotic nuclear division protein 1 homolog n=1 Tax=Dimorphilus gyrociliatus TaxID=2664684 RepID=A0A7I8W366_9ANNE|nr:DgyrCDS10934 [Dimorphilus gyrociliatus]